MGLPADLARRSLKDLLLFTEAWVCLLAARAAIRTVSYRHLEPLFGRRPRRPERSGAEREEGRRRVQRAVRAAARRLPVPSTCFCEAVAAQIMLRRRGIGTTLYYGAATFPERGLTAHVWLRDGREGVVGHWTAAGYHVLACYPGNP